MAATFSSSCGTPGIVAHRRPIAQDREHVRHIARGERCGCAVPQGPAYQVGTDGRALLPWTRCERLGARAAHHPFARESERRVAVIRSGYAGSSDHAPGFGLVAWPGVRGRGSWCVRADGRRPRRSDRRRRARAAGTVAVDGGPPGRIHARRRPGAALRRGGDRAAPRADRRSLRHRREKPRHRGLGRQDEADDASGATPAGPGDQHLPGVRQRSDAESGRGGAHARRRGADRAGCARATGPAGRVGAGHAGMDDGVGAAECPPEPGRGVLLRRPPARTPAAGPGRRCLRARLRPGI